MISADVKAKTIRIENKKRKKKRKELVAVSYKFL